MLRAIAPIVSCALMVAVVACSKADPPEPDPGLARLDVRFGACAATDITWISGPAPAPFTPEQAAARGQVPF